MLWFAVTLVTVVLHVTVAQDAACSLPLTLGRCRAHMPRYYYDAASRSCSHFMYTGCGGNDNNFLSKQQCEESCIRPGCLQPKYVGSCRGRLFRYYYNPTTDSCTPFIFGGCRANFNNFFSRSVCEETCLGAGVNTVPDVDTGNANRDDDDIFRGGVMDEENMAIVLS